MTTETIPFDAAKYLKSDEAIATFLSNMLADGDAATTQLALGVAVRAAGMMEVCKRTGLTRQGINKATRADSRPSFHTVCLIAEALGVQMQFVPKKAAAYVSERVAA
jgi:probable addiction module antidote protein